MKSLSLRKLTLAAVIAAVYAALTMLLPALSYSNWQFRISEALCILPFFFPYTTWGLFVGCMIANIISTVGPIDVIFGSLATLGAGLCTAAIGRGGSTPLRRVLGCLMPVLFNGVIIGAELALIAGGSEGSRLALFAVYGLEVAIGEAGVMFIIGLPLMTLLPKSPALRRLYDTMK